MFKVEVLREEDETTYGLSIQETYLNHLIFPSPQVRHRYCTALLDFVVRLTTLSGLKPSPTRICLDAC